MVNGLSYHDSREFESGGIGAVYDIGLDLIGWRTPRLIII